MKEKHDAGKKEMDFLVHLEYEFIGWREKEGEREREREGARE